MMNTIRAFTFMRPALVLLSFLIAPAVAQAQGFPTKPIQVIVPFAGGSASDVITRIMLERASQNIGQRFVVDNRPGAGGNIGTLAVAKADPDGYTLVMSTSGPLAANKILYRDLGYDPQKDLEPISLFAILPNIIVTSTKLPVKSVADLIAHAKQHPMQLNYGSVGVGSSQHLSGAYFEQLTGVQLVHVPYRNISQYTTDLLAGTVPLGFQWLPNVSGPLASGGARALAVTSAQRMPALPDVPTAAEAGIKGYESSGWLALFAPRGTPQPIIARLHKEVAAAMQDPDVRRRFVELGAEPTASTPQELAKFVASELDKWRDVIVRANIPVGKM
jgi:tripartite-type tricarboxylate transporter receptor subunit TctC